jgi:Tol biopolymer transport system component
MKIMANITSIVRLLATIALSQCNSDLDILLEVPHTIPVPDGQSLVYQSSEGGLGWHIMLMSLNYRDTFTLTPGFFDITPQWSPDKRWIVFTRGLPPEGNLRIWKMNFDGKNKSPLTPSEKHCQGGRVSPDSRRIAFGALSGTRYDLFTMDTSGGEWQQVTTSSRIPFYDAATYAFPGWAPDGRRIVFSFHRFDLDTDGLAIIDLVTNTFYHLSCIDSLRPYDADWSPTRDEIAFVGVVPGTSGTRVFTLALNEKRLLQLTHSWGSSAPDWSPDGETIAYSNKDSLQGDESLWIMNRDGSNPRKLVERPGASLTQPCW